MRLFQIIIPKALTEALVATGEKAGVLISPWGVLIKPALAFVRESASTTLNEKPVVIGLILTKRRQLIS